MTESAATKETKMMGPFRAVAAAVGVLFALLSGCDAGCDTELGTACLVVKANIEANIACSGHVCGCVA